MSLFGEARRRISPMPDQNDLDELTTYLMRTSRLSLAEAGRVLEDILAFLHETPEAFIRRRHLELQHQGLANREIFARLAVEVAARRFSAPALSLRQIRRIIYG